MSEPRKDDIWILGANGRSGRAIAAALAEKNLPMTFVGRDGTALRQLASSLGVEAGIVVASAIADIAAAITRVAPRVVINTIGPFSSTAVPVVKACPPGTHYVDVGNELPALMSLYAMHDELVATNRCVVHGAGWGVLATESVVYKLCTGRSVPLEVRVDNIAAVKASGPLGHTLAEGIIDGIIYGGRRYKNGQLKFAFAGSDHEVLTLPDGSTAKTGLIPTAELEAARRASRAPNVVAGFPAAPSGPIRFIVPLVALLFAIPAVRNFAEKKIAKIAPAATQRQVSWARARAKWPDGTERTGWLRAGDGYDFLAKAAAAVAQRLVEGQGRPGCFTPGSLFNAELAEEAGGEFIMEAPPPPVR